MVVVAVGIRVAVAAARPDGVARWVATLPDAPLASATDLLDGPRGSSGIGTSVAVAGRTWSLPSAASRVWWVSAPGGRSGDEVGRSGVVVATDSSLPRLRPDGTSTRIDSALTTFGTPDVGSTADVYTYNRWEKTPEAGVRWTASVVREARTDRVLHAVTDGVVMGVVDGGVVVQRGGALLYDALQPPRPITVALWSRSDGTERVVATTDDLALDNAERLQDSVTAAGGSTAVVSGGPDGRCLRLVDLRRSGRDAVRPCPADRVVLSADGRWLAPACDNTGVLTDLVTGARRTVFRGAGADGPGGTVCTTFSADGSRVRQELSVEDPPLAWECVLATGTCVRVVIGTG